MWRYNESSNKKGLMHKYVIMLKSRKQMFNKKQMPDASPDCYRENEGEAA